MCQPTARVCLLVVLVLLAHCCPAVRLAAGWLWRGAALCETRRHMVCACVRVRVRVHQAVTIFWSDGPAEGGGKFHLDAQGSATVFDGLVSVVSLVYVLLTIRRTLSHLPFILKARQASEDVRAAPTPGVPRRTRCSASGLSTLASAASPRRSPLCPCTVSFCVSNPHTRFAGRGNPCYLAECARNPYRRSRR